MPAVSLSIFGGVGAQFFDNNGVILTGGKIFTYEAGTTTPLATYTSSQLFWTPLAGCLGARFGTSCVCTSLS
jgi:hypothetical protein